MPGLCVSPPGGAEPPNGPVHQHDNVRPPPARGLPAGRELNSNKGEEWPQICQEGSIREPEPRGKLGALMAWGRGRPDGCGCGGRRARESHVLFGKSSSREKRCLSPDSQWPAGALATGPQGTECKHVEPAGFDRAQCLCLQAGPAGGLRKSFSRVGETVGIARFGSSADAELQSRARWLTSKRNLNV